MTHFGSSAVTALKTALPMDGIPMKTLFTVGALLPCVGIAILLKQIVDSPLDFIPFFVGFTFAASLGLNLVSVTVVSLIFAMISYKLDMAISTNRQVASRGSNTDVTDDDEEDEDI